MSRIKIKLSKKEFEEAQNYAKARNKKEKRFGAGTYGDKLTAVDAHIIGILGEIAVAKFLGIDFDRNIYNDKGDDGQDLLGKIAVKTTTYVKEPLLRAEVKSDNEDIKIYVCCCVDKNKLNEIYIVGWASRNKVILAKKRKFMRYGPTNYVMSEDQLKNPKDLVNGI